MIGLMGEAEWSGLPLRARSSFGVSVRTESSIVSVFSWTEGASWAENSSVSDDNPTLCESNFLRLLFFQGLPSDPGPGLECPPSPVSAHPVRQSPMAPTPEQFCGRAPYERSVYNRREAPSMPGLLRLFRAACDSTSSIDVTRSMRVSMYGTTCAWCANRTLAPGYLGRARGPEHAVFGPELSPRKSSASLE